MFLGGTMEVSRADPCPVILSSQAHGNIPLQWTQPMWLVLSIGCESKRHMPSWAEAFTCCWGDPGGASYLDGGTENSSILDCEGCGTVVLENELCLQWILLEPETNLGWRVKPLRCYSASLLQRDPARPGQRRCTQQLWERQGWRSTHSWGHVCSRGKASGLGTGKSTRGDAKQKVMFWFLSRVMGS